MSTKALLALQSSIEFSEERVYTWIGPQDDLPKVRLALVNHWRVMEDQPVIDTPIVNMHPNDDRCVDRRFLTTDPGAWTARRRSS